ncbi:MAG: HAMP domain-containing protein, partial [Candidatus Omnitrophota bacterium]
MNRSNDLRINIQYKITIIFGIIFAFVLLAIFVYLNNNLSAGAYQRIKNNLLKETSLVKSIFEEGIILETESQKIDEIADIIGKDLNLRVTIIDTQGKVLGDSELDGQALIEVENHLMRPEVRDALASGVGESRRFSTTIKKDLLYIAMIFGKDESQGFVRLSVPLSEIELISSNLKRLLIASLLFAFVLAIVIGFVASAFISRPIKEISQFAKGIARGDFSKRTSISTNDEISELAKAFNYMSEQIRARINDVTASKSKFEAVLLSMFEGVMVVDPKGTILLMNQTLKD